MRTWLTNRISKKHFPIRRARAVIFPGSTLENIFGINARGSFSRSGNCSIIGCPLRGTGAHIHFAEGSPRKVKFEEIIHSGQPKSMGRNYPNPMKDDWTEYHYKHEIHPIELESDALAEGMVKEERREKKEKKK